MELSELLPGNSVIEGEQAFDFLGTTLSDTVIDANGFDDFVLGVYSAAPNGPVSGKAYVVFGRQSGFPA